MLCELCKKNEATVHLKEFHNNEVHDLHICVECASKKEKESSLQAFGFNLAEVLFNLEKTIEKAAEAQAEKSPKQTIKLTCPTCGWTSAKLHKSGGRLGCSDCYKTFETLIRDALGRVQFGSVHLGKRPAGNHSDNTLALQYELEKQQQKLNELIKREEYEAAAVCRDKILQLKAQIAAGKNAQEAKNE